MVSGGGNERELAYLSYAPWCAAMRMGEGGGAAWDLSHGGLLCSGRSKYVNVMSMRGVTSKVKRLTYEAEVRVRERERVEWAIVAE